uniref:Uncharacterized protein LOC101491713 n=1 Tax=Cicer arietinum TaxID=3827 RepID=A0A1S2XHA1_CICAR|nr:uncharacterized protein LOC101491713 [Cicer arietinum]
MDSNNDLDHQNDEVVNTKSYENEVKRGEIIMQKVGWNQNGQPIDPNSSMMHTNPSNEEILDKLKILTEQVAYLVKKNKGKQLPECQREIQLESENGSCNICRKSLPDLFFPTQSMAGKGTLYNTLGEVLHHNPILVGHVKVSPVIALEPLAPLPILDNDGDMMFLREAIGSYVAWPKNLIQAKPTENVKKVDSKNKLTGPQMQKFAAQQMQVHGKNKYAKIQKLDRGKSVVVPKISHSRLS